MKIPTKTLKNGFSMPVYGLGLWGMGGGRERDESSDEKEIAVIKLALDSGVYHIDTAEIYGDGHSEELLAEALKEYDRSTLFISSKVWGENQGYEGTIKACKASLKRMNLDYVDLYMLHSYPKPGISIKDTMKAMDELVERGLVRHIGVSNCSPKRFEEAQSNTRNQIVYNQVHYNVQFREPEHYDMLKHAMDNDYFIAAWRPVQKGMLPESELMKNLAKKYGKSETQVAINWLISQDNVITLSKTSSPEHLEENLGALSWNMDEEDVERIRKEFPDQRSRSDAVPLNYQADKEDK